MKLPTNENFLYTSIYYFRDKGFDALSIGIENPSIMDSEIMTIAIKEEKLS